MSYIINHVLANYYGFECKLICANRLKKRNSLATTFGTETPNQTEFSIDQLVLRSSMNCYQTVHFSKLHLDSCQRKKIRLQDWDLAWMCQTIWITYVAESHNPQSIIGMITKRYFTLPPN